MNKEPFLKWAGGKRWLVSRHSNLFPKFTGRYIEPFLGSGAVFFHLRPSSAILADKNAELIEAYEIVRDHHRALETRLERFHELHSKAFYYDVRSSKPPSKIDRAARFIYLNRTCWNGLYRVNLSGGFNVPIGTKSEVKFPENTLAELSIALRKAAISTSDFEATIDKATKGDFVFVDPPYTVLHNNNGFIKYNDVLFSWADQERLATAVKRASNRGAHIFISNADHIDVARLYTDFETYTLKRASVLSGKAEHRRATSEAAFLNYSPSEDSL